MEMIIKYFGYIDNPHITNTFLISTYKEENKDNFYFHELTNDNRKIKGFRQFNQLSFKNDILIDKSEFVKKNVKVDDEPVFVVKFNLNIEIGSYNEVLIVLIKAIIKQELKSKIFIKQIQNIYLDAFYIALRKYTLEVFSSPDGVSKVKIKDYLRAINNKRLFEIVLEKDKRFNKLYEEIIQTKNKRELSIPEEVTVIETGIGNNIILRKGLYEYSILSNILGINICSPDENIENLEGVGVVWKLKSIQKTLLLSSKSDRNFALLKQDIKEHLDLNSSFSAKEKSPVPQKLRKKIQS